MKPIQEMSIGELAAFICSYLRDNGVEVVLSGGGCVSIYTDNKYASLDLDFIEFRGPRGKKKLKSILKEIGFSCKGASRYFEHPDTEISLEFPSPPLSVGKEPVKEIIVKHFPTGDLSMISPTDCVKDRLAAYYHWQDRQSLEQALSVTKDNPIDLGEVERWSANEGMAESFSQIKARFIEALKS
ncbi:MAG: hypothetical protein P4L61_01980 [Candidatus Pacebacteria bacterium]|nr:hypothetical protein [Candidatus Paceibacterota bacterium]